MKYECKFLRPKRKCTRVVTHMVIATDEEGSVTYSRLICSPHADLVNEVLLGLVLVNEFKVVTVTEEEEVPRQKNT